MTGYLKLSDFSIRGIEQIKSEIILQITNYINENDLGSGSVSVDDIVDALTITVNDDGKAQVNLPINTSDVQGLDDLIIAINDSIANLFIAIGDKSNIGHQHVISDIDGLQDGLDEKATTTEVDTKLNDYYTNVSDNIMGLFTMLENHEKALINTEDGLHGVRIWNGKVQQTLNEGVSWEDVVSAIDTTTLQIPANNVIENSSKKFVTESEQASITSSANEINSHAHRIDDLETTVNGMDLGVITTVVDANKNDISNLQGRVDVIEDALDNTTIGQDGLSAYEIAVNNGFTESESDWLLSLNGTDGISGIDGIDGKSSYDVAIDNGFIGSESEFIESLKGQKGDKGERGDGWNIVKTYGSVVEMDADFSNVTVEDGDLVSISTNPDEEYNAKVFMKGSTAFHFVVDLSGAQGIKGETGATGERGESGFSAYQLAINNGFVGTMTEWLAFLKGEKGEAGAMQDLTGVEQSIQNVQQQVTAYDEEIDDIRNKLALSKITSGALVGNNAITVTLPEGGTFLVVTQVQITGAIANLELVSATGAVYSVTKLSPNAESILTYSGMNLFLKNESIYYISYFIYRLL